MRGLKRNPWLFGLGVLLAVPVVYGGHARADVITDQSGSIVIYPKVIADGTRDTIIQLTNRSNMSAQAHCFYIASGTCSDTTTDYCNMDTDCPTGQTCVLPCNEVDFDLFLTAQQPTMWRVSTGRLVSLTPPCKLGQLCSCDLDQFTGGQECPGFDPGTGAFGSFAVKPTGTNFRGELKCYQTDPDFVSPMPANSLLGTAVLEVLGTGQISEYNAIAISGNSTTGNNLLLNNVEYNACPRNLVMNHWTEGGVDEATDTLVLNELALVPCTELLEQQVPTRARALFTIVNEFEQSLSAATTFDCFLIAPLVDIGFPNFTKGTLGSDFAKTRITPPSGTICLTGDRRGLDCSTDDNAAVTGCPNHKITAGFCNVTTARTCQTNSDCPTGETCTGGISLGCRPWSGLLGELDEFHVEDSGAFGTAAANLHTEGGRTSTSTVPADIIVVPALQ